MSTTTDRVLAAQALALRDIAEAMPRLIEAVYTLCAVLEASAPADVDAAEHADAVIHYRQQVRYQLRRDAP